MNELLPIIRRVRRPFVVAESVPDGPKAGKVEPVPMVEPVAVVEPPKPSEAKPARKRKGALDQ